MIYVQDDGETIHQNIYGLAEKPRSTERRGISLPFFILVYGVLHHKSTVTASAKAVTVS